MCRSATTAAQAQCCAASGGWRAGEPLDGSGLKRFEFAHLRDLTQLTSIEIGNSGHQEAPGVARRAKALLQLLADAPRGLRSLSVSIKVEGVNTADMGVIRQRVTACHSLKRLVLSPLLATANGFFKALRCGKPWLKLQELNVSGRGNGMGANDLALLGTLSQLTSLLVDDVSDAAASMGLTAISSLHKLNELRLSNVALVSEAGFVVPMGDALQGLSNLVDLDVYLDETHAEVAKLPHDDFTVFHRLTQLIRVLLDGNNVELEQAAILAALPQLSSLALRGCILSLLRYPGSFPLPLWS